MRKTLFALVVTALASSSAMANTATSTIAVEVENRAITLTNVQGLNFGVILPFGRVGSVTVNTAGAVSVNSAHVTDASNISASSWAVSGVPNAPYQVTLPGSATITNGTENMTVNAFTRTGGSTQLSLDAGGNASFNVGATLVVGTNQPAGVYSGNFSVTVNYN